VAGASVLTAGQYRLGELIGVKAGYPWRGSVPIVEGGRVRAVQAKDISEIGALVLDDCIRTELTGKRDADWLRQGDVLFTNKGTKNTAVHVDCDLPDVTCASSIYLLQVKPAWRNQLNMKFIAWQLNQLPLQTYFKRSAEGSLQVSLRRQVVEDAMLSIPDLHTQNIIARLYVASQQEHRVLTSMIENRKMQQTAIATELLNRSKGNYHDSN
jgi:hypothetical protein